jgi:TfoX/Sxy family transcriptional regulator of competence genes
LTTTIEFGILVTTGGKGVDMRWKKSSGALTELLETAMGDFPADKRLMFGGPAYFVNNNMFAAVHQDGIIVRLAGEDRDAMLAGYDGAAPFEPMEGRAMKAYVTVPEALYNDREALREWLNRSYAYAESLPPKVRKRRKRVGPR